MEALPEATLILVPAQFAFGFFVILLDPVAPVRVFDHALQRGVCRKVTPEIFGIARLPTCRTLPNQPAEATHAAPIHTLTANRDEACFQAGATPFLPIQGLPLSRGLRGVVSALRSRQLALARVQAP